LKRLFLYFLMFLMLVCLCGCVVFGKDKRHQPFEADDLEGLVIGQTSAADVTAVFGAPSEVVELTNGNAYIYRRSVAKATALWLILVSFGNFDVQQDQVVFFFDQNDVLSHYGVSLNADKASYGFPF